MVNADLSIRVTLNTKPARQVLITLTDVLTEPNYAMNALHDSPLTLKREFTASNELYSDH